MNATATQTSTSPTPILDRLALMSEPAKPGKRRLARIIASLTLCAYVAPIVLIALRPPLEEAFFRWLQGNLSNLFANDWAGVRVILTGFAIVLMSMAATTIHECGHLLAGLAVGFRVRLLRVWGLQIDRNLRISRCQSFEGQGPGGTDFLPGEMRNRPKSVAFMFLAGPLANLVSSYVLFILPFHKSLITASFILISCFHGIYNLVPFRGTRSTSDGMRLFTLLYDRAKHERWLALAQIMVERRAGVETESLSPELLAAAIAVRDNSPETLLAHLLAYAAAYNQHREEDAAQLLETSLQYSSYATSSLREALMVNAAIFQAEKRKRVDLAEQWLAALPQKLEVPYRRLMVEGAILEARQDFSGALQKVSEIEKAISSNTDPKRQQAALKPFAKWRAELEQKAAPSTAYPAPSA